MIIKKTNISARVECTLKKIVENSKYSHKDAYEIGSKIIAIDNVEEVLLMINKDPIYEQIKKQAEYELIKARQIKLQKELEEL